MQSRSPKTDPYWSDIFPFEPYEKQAIGINQAVDILKERGLYLLEGACGTGKTLIALSAVLALIRDPDTIFQRAFVVTSKKQQLRAFEDDLSEINRGLTDRQFSGLTLVGKADLCPYVSTGKIEKEDLHHRCTELRDNTNRIMSKASKEDRVEIKADAGVGLASRAEVSEDEFIEPLRTANVEAPYQQEIPEAVGQDYCPFFAQHFVNDHYEIPEFHIGDGMRPEETLRNGIIEGTCPHAAMKTVAEDGDVLIGNYKHVFSPATVRGFTGRFFDDTTILIIDEAHELSTNVRDELSYSTTMQTLDFAIKDVEKVIGWTRGVGDGQKASLASAIVNRSDYDADDLEVLKSLLIETRKIFEAQIRQQMGDEIGSNWENAIYHQDPEEPHSVDVHCEGADGETSNILARWMDQNGTDDDWMRVLYLGYSVAYVREQVSKKIDQMTPEGDYAIDQVRELLRRWLVGDHTEYFRELKLSPRREEFESPPQGRPWERYYHTQIRVNNCIPQDEIAATLDAFGASIVMSATLEPLDVYREETGIGKLEAGYQPYSSIVTQAASRYQDDSNNSQFTDDDSDDDSDDDESSSEDESSDFNPDERKRPVKTTVFDNDFPPQNRAGFAVSAPKFTYSNRSPADEKQELRHTYREIILSVAATTPGNVIVFMPSYAEGEWAAEQIRESSRVQKEVLVDESSSDAETEQLKRDFLDGGPKVLTTGLRGTLTEGVDFSGDKLHAAVICGVPIAYTGSELASAVEAAYSSRFGEWLGFDYAFTVPAIRKTRQAIGRVIRGTDDVGVRVLADVRYTDQAGRAGVRKHFPEHAQDEFQTVRPNQLDAELRQFWSGFDL